jgi:hypothetical protein
MAASIEKYGEGNRLKRGSIKCFLAYMRNIAVEKIAFIEQILPEKIKVRPILRYNSRTLPKTVSSETEPTTLNKINDLDQAVPIRTGKIVRKIDPEVHAISQEETSDIIRELNRLATQGRPNRHLSALESLGLCFMCLAASRLRLPTHLIMIKAIKKSAIFFSGDYPILKVPTLFGERPVRISNRVARYLLAVSSIPSKNIRETILQSPRGSLTRTFDQALKNCGLASKLGNITYRTMLSPPHHFGREIRL